MGAVTGHCRADVLLGIADYSVRQHGLASEPRPRSLRVRRGLGIELDMGRDGGWARHVSVVEVEGRISVVGDRGYLEG